MVFGVGIDIENHSRFIKYQFYSESDNPMLSVFTAKEIANYKKIGSHLCYALSFSCKEAFFKAFGQSWNDSEILLHDIELFFDDRPEMNKTKVVLSGETERLRKKFSIKEPFAYLYQIGDENIIFEVVLEC